MGRFWSTERDGRSLFGQRILIHQILRNNGTGFLCGLFDEESRRIEESRGHEEELSPNVQYGYELSLARVEGIADLLNEILGSSSQYRLHWDSVQSQDNNDSEMVSILLKSISTRAATQSVTRGLIPNTHCFLVELLSANCSKLELSYSCLAFGDRHDSKIGVFLKAQKWERIHGYRIIVAVRKTNNHQSKCVIKKDMLSLIRLAFEGDFLIVKVLIEEYLFGHVESNILNSYTCVQNETTSIVNKLSMNDEKPIAKCSPSHGIRILDEKSNYHIPKRSFFDYHTTDERATQHIIFSQDNEHLSPFHFSWISKIIDRSPLIPEFLAKISADRKTDLPSPICIEFHADIHDEMYINFENCNSSNTAATRHMSEIDKVIKFLNLKFDKNQSDAPVTTELRRLSTCPVIDGDYIDIMQESKRTWFKLVKILLKHAVDVNIQDGEGNSLLHHLSTEKFWPDKSGMDRIARKLIKAGAKVDAKNELGLTPLHSAVIGGYSKIVDVLLKHGADVNASTNEKLFTPIHLAATEKYLVGRDFPIIDSLLKNGANLESRTIDEETVLHLCITKKIMYSEFIQDENPWEVYYLIKYLLNLGCDVDAKNANGQTPLHLACQLDCEKTVEELLLHGANANIEDQFGLPPLLYRKGDWTAARSILTSHLMKLIAAEFYVSEKNRVEVQKLESTYEHLSVLKQKYLKEVRFMKEVKVDSHTLLYDILFKETHDMARYVKNKGFTKFLFRPTRSVYHYRKFLNLHYKRGYARRILIESGKKVLKLAIGSVLPDSCFENVIRNLSDQDLTAITTRHEAFRFRKQYKL